MMPRTGTPTTDLYAKPTLTLFVGNGDELASTASTAAGPAAASPRKKKVVLRLWKATRSAPASVGAHCIFCRTSNATSTWRGELERDSGWLNICSTCAGTTHNMCRTFLEEEQLHNDAQFAIQYRLPAKLCAQLLCGISRRMFQHITSRAEKAGLWAAAPGYTKGGVATAPVPLFNKFFPKAMKIRNKSAKAYAVMHFFCVVACMFKSSFNRSMHRKVAEYLRPHIDAIRSWQDMHKLHVAEMQAALICFSHYPMRPEDLELVVSCLHVTTLSQKPRPAASGGSGGSGTVSAAPVPYTVVDAIKAATAQRKKNLIQRRQDAEKKRKQKAQEKAKREAQKLTDREDQQAAKRAAKGADAGGKKRKSAAFAPVAKKPRTPAVLSSGWISGNAPAGSPSKTSPKRASLLEHNDDDNDDTTQVHLDALDFWTNSMDLSSPGLVDATKLRDACEVAVRKIVARLTETFIQRTIVWHRAPGNGDFARVITDVVGALNSDVASCVQLLVDAATCAAGTAATQDGNMPALEASHPAMFGFAPSHLMSRTMKGVFEAGSE
jgi:hypothetical protein